MHEHTRINKQTYNHNQHDFETRKITSENIETLNKQLIPTRIQTDIHTTSQKRADASLCVLLCTPMDVNQVD